MPRDGVKTALILCGGTAVALVVTTKIINSKPAAAGWIRRIMSGHLDATAERPDQLPETQRARFTEQELIRMKPTPEHTHGVSAADRSTGTFFGTCTLLLPVLAF